MSHFRVLIFTYQTKTITKLKQNCSEMTSLQLERKFVHQKENYTLQENQVVGEKWKLLIAKHDMPTKQKNIFQWNQSKTF